MNKHVIFPGVQLFRLLDEYDSSDNRVYHSYQFLFVGEIEMGLQPGMLQCEVIGPTAVSLTVPAVSGLFVNSFDLLNRFMASKGKQTAAATLAHTNAVNQYMDDSEEELLKYKLLVRFDKTGEELDNSVWTKTSGQLGVVQPRSAIVPYKILRRGKAFDCCTLVVGFSIARVEKTKRYRVVQTRTAGRNAVDDDLDDDMEGMNLNG